jgi:hypothetical protein
MLFGGFNDYIAAFESDGYAAPVFADRKLGAFAHFNRRTVGKSKNSIRVFRCADAFAFLKLLARRQLTTLRVRNHIDCAVRILDLSPQVCALTNRNARKRTIP